MYLSNDNIFTEEIGYVEERMRAPNPIKNWILKNPLVKGYYYMKEYFNIAMMQLSWFTSKAIDVMGWLYVLEWFGLEPSRFIVGMSLVMGFLLMVVLGWMIKHSGIYDTDTIISAKMDPVSLEKYKMSLHYNKKYKVK